MGVLKKLTSEYFGETERKEDAVVMDGVERVDFTDRNEKRHRNGYRIVDGGHDTLKKLIRKLVDTRGPECDLNDVDVSNVTDMNQMFNNSHFNGDISGWDVSQVTDMSYMFYNSAFTGENGSISGWDVSGVRNMSFMFYGTHFDGDISGWDVSGVTNMRYMFYNSHFTSENGDISGWDVSRVRNMEGMFDESPLENNPPEWYI